MPTGLTGRRLAASAQLFAPASSMKNDIHPDYHPVVFFDIGANFKFLTRSTMTSKEKVKWEDGNEYPLRHGRHHAARRTRSSPAR